MRTLLTITGVCLLVAILLPACGSNHISIEKRKHLKGYHITTGHDKKRPKPIEEERHTEEVYAQAEEGQLPSQESVSHDNIPSEPQLRKGTSTMDATPAIAAKDNEGVSGKRRVNSADSPRPKAVTSVINDVMKESSDGSDARSILWLIVVIILILWAISFLAGGLGLGSLIHLLLLVALIVFILWMLRII